jgi:chromosome segregation ATPase
VADESVGSHAPESLEELSGEWMRQQLQEAAVNTRPPAQEAKKADAPPRPSWSPLPAPAPVVSPQTQPERPHTPPADDVLVGLAQSVSQAVVNAVSQLEHRRSEEKHSLERNVQEQERRLAELIGRVTEIQSRFDKLSGIVEQQRTLAQTTSDTYERLSGEIVEIQKRDASRESVLEELRRETLDLSVSFSDRQDQVGGRLDLQQADVESVKSELAQIKPSMQQAVERLERHSQAIKAIFEAERRREETLERLSEAAASLKNSTLRYPEGLSEELL